MNQEIHFKGLSLTPDDHHAALGELSLCANTELHNGALRPSVLNKTTIGSLTLGGQVAKLLYVHVGNVFTHYICKSGSSIVWFNEDGSHSQDYEIKSFPNLDVYSVTSVGNTLCILVSDGIHYARWNNNKYEYIGSHLPECNLSFGLSGRYFIDYETFDVEMKGWFNLPLNENLEHYDHATANDNWNTSNDRDYTEKILAHVNKFISEYHDKGKFMFPFQVRYAYRLYDGSLIMHSAPILMTCNSGTAPFVFARSHERRGGENGFDIFNDCVVSAGLFNLDYKLINTSLKEELKKWSDIIKSVDVFISKPFYRYDANGLLQSVNLFDTENTDNGYCVAKVTESVEGLTPEVSISVGEYGLRHQKHNNDHFVFYGRPEHRRYHFVLPTKSDAKFNAEIRENSNFFLLASIKPDYLATERTVINLKDGFYGSIKEEQDAYSMNTVYSSELMTDDYESHDTIIPKVSYVYNSRLNVSNIMKRLYAGYNAGAQFAFTDGYILMAKNANTGIVYPSYDQDIQNGCSEKVQIRYLINENGRNIEVVAPEFTFGCNTPLTYIYYPNPRAYKAIITRRSQTYEVDLKPHPMLNGAVYFEGFDDIPVSNTAVQFETDTQPTMEEPIVPVTNKLYTSEVNNPFYFPLEGINTIGIGTILGLASTTRALSQGQFGQYPLMVFCTDGIWALDVSATGSFSAIHPISREVCVNPASICQLDQSVLFATKRGIAQIVESSVSPVSDVLDGPVFDVAGKLPVIAEHASDLSPLVAFKVHPFDFFTNEDTQLLYDFVNQRVLAVKADGVEDCAYVFSITDASWSTMNLGKCLTVVNAYPYPYIQRTDGTLLCLDKNYSYGTDLAQGESHVALVITRAIGFSSLMQAIQEFQQVNDCMDTPTLVIHGSNDSIHWSMVGRVKRNHAAYLPAHPFRWFRISLFLNMRPAEKYSKLILGVIEKYQKL